MFNLRPTSDVNASISENSTHCMHMHIISVVTPTGFEGARAKFA